MDIVYRALAAGEATPALLDGFIRRQEVTRCWRKENGRWVIRDIAFVDDWDEDDICRVTSGFKACVEGGGAVYAAFDGARLIGFASVPNWRIGSEGQYVPLRSMHVSQDWRGRGVGRQLFGLACRAAKALGGRKMYISGQSSVETQAFYRAMGCVEATEYYAPAVEDEPFDCQLERDLADVDAPAPQIRASEP